MLYKYLLENYFSILMLCLFFFIDFKLNFFVFKFILVFSRIFVLLDKILEGSESFRFVRRKDDSLVIEEIEIVVDDSSVLGVFKISKLFVSEKQIIYKDDDFYFMDFERIFSFVGFFSERFLVSVRSIEVSYFKFGFND